MRSLSISFLVVLWACESPITAPNGFIEIESNHFDHPQALVFVGDRIIVGNTGYDANEWRPGGLLVIDVETLSVTAPHPTARQNPQRLLVEGERLFVVETGTIDFSDFENPQVGTPGAVEIFSLDVDGLGESAEFIELSVAPVDLAVRDGRGVVSSALEPVVWGLDLQDLSRSSSISGPHPLTPSRDLGLGSVRPWRDGFVSVDFNSDYAHLLDEKGVPNGCSIDLGSSETVEGAQSPWVEGDDLYVIMALSGVVRRVDLAALSIDCSTSVDTVVTDLGQIPNDLHIRGDLLYVVHSGDNNVVEYSVKDGTEQRRYVLPRGANPWHAAFSTDGRYLAVTEWDGQGLSIFDLDSGVRRRVGAQTAD